MSIRLFLADDHRMLRDGLRALVARLPGVEVIGEAGDGRTTVAMVKELQPDIVVMDIGMPGLNGMEATRQIISECPRIKVIALSMQSDGRYVAEMLKAGASGYLPKESAFEELGEAVRTVAAGRTYLSPEITGTVMKDYLGACAFGRSTISAALTPREREVLQLIAEGLSTKEIAHALNVSAKTADAHRQRVMKKLRLRSVAELTKYAIRAGFTEP